MENTKYKVESGIPVPDISKYTELYQTLENLAVGDSFSFEAEAKQNLYQRACGKNIKVAIRKDGDDHCRVWRLR
jgi:hypothetical protein